MPRGIYDRKKSKPGKSAAKLVKVETKVSAPSKEEIRNVLEQATAEATARLRQEMAVSAPSNAVDLRFCKMVRVWRSDSEDNPNDFELMPFEEFERFWNAIERFAMPFSLTEDKDFFGRGYPKLIRDMILLATKGVPVQIPNNTEEGE